MYATFTYIPKYINEETSCQAKPNLSIAKANFKNKIKLTITVEPAKYPWHKLELNARRATVNGQVRSVLYAI